MQTKEMKNKRGISLITLVITIIVVIILAAAVILTLNNNNPVENAKEATFKSDVATLQDDLNLYIANQYTKSNGIYDLVALNLSDTTNPTIGNELKSVESGKLKGKAEVKNGKLVFTGKDENEIKWFYEIINQIGEGTRNKVDAAWNKPYVPSEFHYVEGTVATGYVIGDSKGNEFVWIPVDGTNVIYTRHYTTDSSYVDVPDDEYPTDITAATEKSIVEAVGGFYIGRYEAGVPEGQTAIDGTSVATSNVTGTPVSKKGAISWTYIDYTNANTNAKSYKNNSEVASGLLTGIQWDTVCKWLENNNYDVKTDSRTWGNYSNSTFTYTNSNGINTTKNENSSVKVPTGSTEYTKSNNIYDIAGNSYEWTNEMNLNFRALHGGSYNHIGSGRPAFCRTKYDSINVTYPDFGFRIALYIK